MHFTFDSPLLEAFAELDSLQEDTTDKEASKRFWAAAKNKEIDEEAFHTAFDTELTDLGLMSLFDEDGKLKSRNTYEQIKAAKEASPDNWTVKALNKLWVLQYVENIGYKVDKERWARYEAERKAAAEAKAKQQEEERLAMVQEFLDVFPAALAKVDHESLEKFLDICKCTAEDLTIEFNKTTKADTAYLKLIVPNYSTRYLYGIKPAAPDKVVELTKTLDYAIKKELGLAREKANNVIDVFAKIAAKNDSSAHANAILLGDSGTLYKIATCSSGRAPDVSISDIKEPYKVIFVRAALDDGNRITYKNSYAWAYYSWDSSEADKLHDVLPTPGKSSGVWSEKETVEVKAPYGDYFSRIDNIDSWAKTNFTEYSTD